MRSDARLSWPRRGFAAVAFAVAAAATLLPVVAYAEGGVHAAPPAEARAWLQRVHGAASQRNYRGTLVVSAGGSMSSARLAHYCQGTQFFERIEVLDGQTRQVYRHNDRVMTLWPAAKVARVEQRDSVALFPAVLSGSAEQLFERYDMVPEGADRVAGYGAAVYLLRPRDGQRFAQRLWAEQSSGLLLRADVLAPDGRVLETAAFTDLEIDVKPRPETVLKPMKSLDGYRVMQIAPQRTALDAEGWQFKSLVPGFKQISCVKRSLEPPATGDRGAAADVLQTIFSDGLTHVSVFIEPFHADRHRPGGAVIGATHTLRHALGPYWVTVMGDVPMATLKQFAAALERTR
jgi:sigma-E factor negative regulatory protein RseB